MFNSSKYTNWYNSIISQAQSQLRKKYEGVYYEEHHIVPKCLGGSNKKINLVLLTAKEHFLCHWLLCKMVDDINSRQKLYHAFSSFLRSTKIQSRIYTSKQYEIARMYASRAMTMQTETKKKERLKKSSETKKRMFASGELIPWNKGKTGVYSDETLSKMGKYERDEKWRLNASESARKQFIENGHPSKGKTGYLSGNFGSKRSEETKKRMSEASLKTKISCPVCGRTTNPGGYKKGKHGLECTKLPLMSITS